MQSVSLSKYGDRGSGETVNIFSRTWVWRSYGVFSLNRGDFLIIWFWNSPKNIYTKEIIYHRQACTSQHISTSGWLALPKTIPKVCGGVKTVYSKRRVPSFILINNKSGFQISDLWHFQLHSVGFSNQGVAVGERRCYDWSSRRRRAKWHLGNWPGNLLQTVKIQKGIDCFLSNLFET